MSAINEIRLQNVTATQIQVQPAFSWPCAVMQIVRTKTGTVHFILQRTQSGSTIKTNWLMLC